MASALVLHQGEVDDGVHGCWFLKRPPIAVYVKPLGVVVSDAAWQTMQASFPGLPQGCVPITPQWTPSFAVQVFMKHAGGGPEVSTHVNVRRFGINLDDAYAVTDYYCQGVSFKSDAWMAHLNVPPTGGGLQRAAVFVILIRWGAWDDVALLAPLWRPGDRAARDRVIDQFHQLACLDPDLSR